MILTLLVACASKPAEAPIVVLAAASLTDALPPIAAAFTEAGGPPVTFSFDASSRLAAQVQAGAPADLLITADLPTIQPLDDAGLLAPGTRRDLLGNRLVAVVPADKPAPADAAALAALPRLALAAEGVPAGRYAEAALTHAGVWTTAGPHVVRGDNVRTTLAWVARGEADAGIVYATDAVGRSDVRVAFTFPTGSHPPIVYPAAVVAASARVNDAGHLLAWLASDDTTAAWEKAGFSRP